MKSIAEILIEILDLGEGWIIMDKKIDKKIKEIDIFIEFISSTGYFPRNKELLNVYDYSRSRRIRHLDLFEYKCYLNARIPRVKDGKLGIRNIALKWADERVSFSYLLLASD